MNRADSFERTRSGHVIGKDDLLSVRRRCEEPADGITWQFPCEEEPVDGAIEREFGGTAGEDEEHDVSISPDPPHNGIPSHEVSHRPPNSGQVLCSIKATPGSFQGL